MTPIVRRIPVIVMVMVLMLAAHSQAQSIHYVTFQAQSGHYVVAENGGNSVMNANRGSAGSWEWFEIHDVNGGALESGDLVHIRTSNGYYASQQCLGSIPIPSPQYAYGTAQGCYTWFNVDKYDNANNYLTGPIYSGDQVVLTGNQGMWQAENGGGARLLIVNNWVGAWEKFFISY
jgi:hypothetical protein